MINGSKKENGKIVLQKFVNVLFPPISARKFFFKHFSSRFSLSNTQDGLKINQVSWHLYLAARMEEKGKSLLCEAVSYQSTLSLIAFSLAIGVVFHCRFYHPSFTACTLLGLPCHYLVDLSHWKLSPHEICFKKFQSCFFFWHQCNESWSLSHRLQWRIVYCALHVFGLRSCLILSGCFFFINTVILCYT